MTAPEIFFILVEPAVPGNIGSSARAIKTMGFRNLRLVNPCHHLDEEALMLAHGSHDILQEAKVFQGFREAIADLDFLIGTTARHRNAHEDYYPVEDLLPIVRDKGKLLSRLGIVFGKEESGLSNEQLRACDVMSYIPMKTSFPSLNLGQAVMLYAYYFSRWQHQDDIVKREESKPGQVPFRQAVHQAEEILERTGIKKGSALYHRIRERISLMNETDLHLLLSVIKHLNKIQ